MTKTSIYSNQITTRFIILKIEVSPRQPLKTSIFKPWKRSKIWVKRPPTIRKVAMGLQQRQTNHCSPSAYAHCTVCTAFICARYVDVSFSLFSVNVFIAENNRQLGAMNPNWCATEKVATSFQLFIFRIWLRKSELLILCTHRISL